MTPSLHCVALHQHIGKRRKTKTNSDSRAKVRREEEEEIKAAAAAAATTTTIGKRKIVAVRKLNVRE